MSLINRMLDDLATRQAPGTESLQGVRLNEPLQLANDGIDRTQLGVLMLVVAAVAGLGWWLWPVGAEIPVPRARPAPATVHTSAPPAARRVAPEAPAEPSAPSPAAEPAPRLQLSARLASLEPAPVRETPPRAIAPKTVDTKPTPTPAKSEHPTTDAVPKPVGAPTPILDPAVERKQRARQALADQDPASALLIVSATDASRDVESAALRAAALQRMGRHAEAAEVYASLTARDPAESGHWVGLGISLEGEQRREPARMAYRRALQSDRLAPSLRAFAQDRVTVLEAP